MKLVTATIAAIFALLIFALPGPANAQSIGWQPPAIQQIAYHHDFFHGRPDACRNPRFRRHHRFLCW